MRKTSNTILSLINIFLSGALAFMNMSEWYKVKVKKETSTYFFSAEGPSPYFYMNSEVYSTVSLVWGLLFLVVLLVSCSSLFKGEKKKITLTFIIVFLFSLLFLFHAQIEK